MGSDARMMTATDWSLWLFIDW